MTTENRLLFSGQSTTTESVMSDGFNDMSFIYLKTTADFEVEVDSFLQIYIDNQTQRMIKINSPSVVNTEQVFLIPQEYRLSEYNQRLAMYFSDVIDIELWGVKTDCCLQTEIERIDRTTKSIDRIIKLRNAVDLISSIGDLATNAVLSYLGGQLVGTVISTVLPAAVRAGFYILNPANNIVPITIRLPTLTSSLLPNEIQLNPSQIYLDEQNYQGQVEVYSTIDNVIVIAEEFL